jgi:hypothetical protein
MLKCVFMGGTKLTVYMMRIYGMLNLGWYKVTLALIRAAQGNDSVVLAGGVYDFQVTNRKEGASHHGVAIVGCSNL